MHVLFVVTEHSSYLGPHAVRRYKHVRRRLEDAFGATVRSAHYEDVESVAGAAALALSGSRAAWAVHDAGAIDRLGTVIRGFGGPVLGICAGMQLLAMFAGGTVETTRAAPEEEYRAVEVLDDRDLLRGLAPHARFYERHTDEVTTLPAGFRLLARSRSCGVEAMAAPERRWWGTQFHPELFTPEHPDGERVLRNFFELARAT